MKKIIIIIIATLVVTALLTTVILVVLPKKDAKPTPTPTPVVSEEVEEVVYRYELTDPFITNMKDSKRFVKASFILILTNEEDKVKLDELDYVIKDTIIKILRNTTEEEYLKDDIQESLRTNIKKELSAVLEIESIKEVFFLELVLQ